MCLLGSMLVGEEPNPVRPRADLRTSSDTVAAVGTLYLGITFLRWVAAFPPLEYEAASQSSKGRQALGLVFPSCFYTRAGPRSCWESAFPPHRPASAFLSSLLPSGSLSLLGDRHQRGIGTRQEALQF